MGNKTALGLLAAVAVTTFVSPAPGLAENPSADCGNTSGYQAGSPWPAYHRCSTRLGMTSAYGARTGTLNWRENLGANVRSPVIAADGTIYVGAGPTMHALSRTGARLWSVYLWGNIASAPAIGADGTVYVVSAAGALAAVNPADGSMRWVYRGAWGTAINTSPLIGADGTIYFVDTLNFIHAVRPDGTAKWVQLFPGPIFSSLTMSRDGQTLYVGSSFLGLRAVSSQNGAIRWVNLRSMGQFSSPTIGADGTIYVGSSTGELFALSPFDGKEKFVASKRLFIFDQWGGISVSPAMTPDGNIVFGTDKGLLIKVTPKGAVVWERPLGGGKITGSPAIDADGVVYVGTDNKRVIAVDAGGTTLWNYGTGSAVWSDPAIGAQGTIYVGSNDNFLYSIGVGAADPFGTPSVPPGQPAAPTVVFGGSEICVNPSTGERYSCNPGGGAATTNGDATYCSNLPSPSTLQSAAPAPGESAPNGWLLNPAFDVAHRPNGSPQLSEPHFIVNGLRSVGTGDNGDSQCSANLCTWSSNLGQAGARLSAADQALLLRDNVRPTCGAFEQNCTVLPPALAVPCEDIARDSGSCLVPNYTKVRYDLSCTADEECPMGHSCTSVCPESSQPGVPSQCNLAQEAPEGSSTPTVDERVSRCVPLEDNANCNAGVGPLAPGEQCYTVTECERSEDVLTEEDTAPTCVDDNGQAIRCDNPALGAQQSARIKTPKVVVSPWATVFEPQQGLALDTASVSSICHVEHSDDPYARDDQGGSPAKSNKQKKWGIDTSADFSTDYGAKSGPFGIVLPHAHARAHFDIIGTVMGRNITVFSLSGDATANLENAEVFSNASAKLFGQEVAKVKGGANLTNGPTGSASATTPQQAMDALNGELNNVGAKAKARLAQVVRVYNRAVQAVEGPAIGLISHDLCKKVLRTALYKGEAIVGARVQEIVDSASDKFVKYQDKLHYLPANLVPLTPAQRAIELAKPEVQQTLEAVLIDPICDAPLTQQTARLVMNRMIERYQDAADEIGDEMDAIFALNPTPPYLDQTPWKKFQGAIDGPRLDSSAKSFEHTTESGDGYKSAAVVAAAEQRFSIIGARATFPIGPIALVLEIQGTGRWGIKGNIEYGFSYDLKNAFTVGSKPLRAYANALAVPYAGVDVDAYVGVGFDFGIGGASVGINGLITLIQVDVPVGGGIDLSVRNVGEEQVGVRQWPPQLAHLGSAPKIPLSKFKLELTGNAQAGMTFRALNGEVALALRVRLLFLKKTWRKKLASFDGFSKALSWVGEFKIPVGQELPVPGLDNLPFDKLTMPQPGYEVLPAFPFPDVQPLGAAAFSRINSLLPNVTTPVPDTEDALKTFMLQNANYFEGWDPKMNLDPWRARAEYPADLTPNEVANRIAALNGAIQSEDLVGVPAGCRLTSNSPPVDPF